MRLEHVVDERIRRHTIGDGFITEYEAMTQALARYPPHVLGGDVRTAGHERRGLPAEDQGLGAPGACPVAHVGLMPRAPGGSTGGWTRRG